MISLRSATKTYEGAKQAPAVTALDSVSLEVGKGEFLVITGRSGSGKSTLLNIAAGLVRPTSGEVLFEGQNLWELSDGDQSRLRAQNVGFVFQFPSLLPALTALENVTLPLSFDKRHVRGDSRGGRVPRTAAELLGMVGLADKLGSHPRQLSAGQQQRVVIARALVNAPEVLFADEPSSDLDEQTEREIMALFKTIHADTGVTVVMVTHTTQLVTYGTRAIEMTRGTIAES
jgi:ABC-type lipoprotein export system ATPase subunit